MTFCETFRKNVARIECATHHERIYNACVWLKKDTFCKEFPQNAKDSSESFPEAVVRRFSLKDVFLRISQNLQEIPCTGVSLQSYSPQRYFKRETQARAFSYEFCEIFKSTTGRLLDFFTISREVSRYAFLSVGFFDKTLLMKIFEDIHAMPVAKE